MDVINKIGRRKSSVARVYLKQGAGNITINGKDFKEYFPMENIQNVVLAPFATIEATGQFDVKINVDGGGFKGQAEAIRLGISRALVQVDEENKKALKAKKFLTRDAREVERKKYGKPKARKSFQFSKR
jgi:small subunit ribosomal protein S9